MFQARRNPGLLRSHGNILGLEDNLSLQSSSRSFPRVAKKHQCGFPGRQAALLAYPPLLHSRDVDGVNPDISLQRQLNLMQIPLKGVQDHVRANVTLLLIPVNEGLLLQ